MGIPYAEVIGDPIAHSKSPTIHKFWLAKLGIEGDYRAVRVGRSELPDYLVARRADPLWLGCNVTMPLKTEAIHHVDGALAAATAAGAVNTIFRHDDKLVGNNTDLRGFAEPFRGPFSDRGSAILIGSGGAAQAIFVALAGLGFDPIKVMSRRPLRGALSRVVKESCRLPLKPDFPPADLIVNTTSLGMRGEQHFPFELSNQRSETIVYDIVYNPLETPLISAAKARGLRTIDGLHMLIGQAAYSFMHFFEGEAPREHDAELRELLTL